jgi:DNA-binding transcriptional MocR family regulator
MRELADRLAPVVRGRVSATALADALRAEVLDGRVVVGDRLPAERRLAEQLGVSRATVSAALGVLRAEGYLASRQGSGTVVAMPADRVDRPDETRAGPALDLTIAAPAAPPELGALAVEAAGRLPALLSGPGLHPLGLRDLRRAVAARLTRRGLPTTTAQVLVTQGALHGWDLLLRAGTRAGDRVLLEQPTYPAAADAARAHGLRLVPLAVDAAGWRPRPDGPAAALALLTPDHQNPTGAYADLDRRRELLGVPATRLVDDQTFSELTLDGAEELPLGALGGDRVVTVGSLSKLVWAGLRIGWIRADPALVTRLASARTSQDLAAPVLDQLLGVAVLGELDRLRADRVGQLRERRDALAAAVAAAGWTAARPAGGAVLWADLGRLSSTRLAVAARAEGVRVPPGTRFSLTGTHDRWLRLPYTQPVPVLADAMTRLRRAAARVGPTDGPVPRWTA